MYQFHMQAQETMKLTWTKTELNRKTSGIVFNWRRLHQSMTLRSKLVSHTYLKTKSTLGRMKLPAFRRHMSPVFDNNEVATGVTDWKPAHDNFVYWNLHLQGLTLFLCFVRRTEANSLTSMLLIWSIIYPPLNYWFESK